LFPSYYKKRREEGKLNIKSAIIIEEMGYLAFL